MISDEDEIYMKIVAPTLILKVLHLKRDKNDIIFLMRQVLVHDYCATKILYYLFEHLNDSKCENSKLQSSRSHRELQFSYKFHLHMTSYPRVMIF